MILSFFLHISLTSHTIIPPFMQNVYSPLENALTGIIMDISPIIKIHVSGVKNASLFINVVLPLAIAIIKSTSAIAIRKYAI